MNMKLSDDLAYIRDIAEAGTKSPALGGRYLVLWGLLMGATMLTHWAIISGQIPVENRYVLLALWIGAAILGTIGNFIIDGTQRDRPGKSAAHNRVDRIIWPVFGAGMLCYFGGVIFAVLVRNAPPLLFNTLLPVAFFGYGMAFAGHAVFAGSALKWAQVAGSMLLAGICICLVGLHELYLVAAFGIMGLTLIPGILQIRNEPQMVV